MEQTARMTTGSAIPAPKTRTDEAAIPVPDIDIGEPVAVIPAASVAPLDGPPDGERINTFLVAPKERHRANEGLTADALGEMRDRVSNKPFTYLVAAFSLGVILARVMR